MRTSMSISIRAFSIASSNVYPRLVRGGVLIFDDYGFPSCSRAREAADRAFASRREKPIYLPTGQALVLKIS